MEKERRLSSRSFQTFRKLFVFVGSRNYENRDAFGSRPDRASLLSAIARARTIVRSDHLRQGLLSSALFLVALPLMLLEASRGVASVNCFSFVPPKGHLPFVSTFTVLITDDVTTPPVYLPLRGGTSPGQKGFVLLPLLDLSLQRRDIVVIKQLANSGFVSPRVSCVSYRPPKGKTTDT